MAIEDIERLKEKITRDPDSKLFVPLAEEYKKAGMYTEAIDTLIKGLDQQPGYLSARVSLGKIYLERGMLIEARDEFEKVISAIPDNLYAHKKLADIYRELGEKDQAIQEFRKVLKLNPMDDWAATNLSELQKQQGPKSATTTPGDAEAPPPPKKPAATEELHKELPAYGEKDLWDIPYEAEKEMAEEQPSELPLTTRNLEITEAITHPEEEEQVPEKPLAEIVRDDETADIQAINAEIPGRISEEEEWEKVSEISPEKEEEVDLWKEPAGDEEVLLEEETQAEAPISREDLELWKSLKEVEDTVHEPVSEAEEADEEALSFDDILQEAEPAVKVSDTGIMKEEVHEEPSDMITEADHSIKRGKYAAAMSIYRKILSSDPDNRQVLQRAEELKTLLKLLGKDKEELIERLDNLLHGIKKRRDEFFGTP